MIPFVHVVFLLFLGSSEQQWHHVYAFHSSSCHIRGTRFSSSSSSPSILDTTTSLRVATNPETSIDPTGKRTTPKEVVSMFDDFAESFEEKLVDVLDYTAPQNVSMRALERIEEDRNGKLYKSAIDAGCGTGLIGPLLRPHVKGPMVGVDLSPKMAELAAELVVDDAYTANADKVKNRMRRCGEVARTAQNIDRLYDGVFTGDLLQLHDASKIKFIDGLGHTITSFPEKPVELIVCTDVLCYFGDMSEILAKFSDRLQVGGDLIFTTETLAQGDYNWVMTVSERYAHDADYVRRMAAHAGLAKVSQTPFTPRWESGEKVLGLLHTFTKTDDDIASTMSPNDLMDKPPL